MKLTRRSALALPVALALTPAVVSAKGRVPSYPWLSCFLVDRFPASLSAAYARDGDIKAVYDKDKDLPVWYLDESGGTIRRLGEGPDQVAVPRVDCSDADLESAAGALLDCAAEYTKYDFTHGGTYEGEPRIIAGPSRGVVGTPGRINSIQLSVGDPFYLGRLMLYPDGRRGLVLMNPAAVVWVLRTIT